MGNLALISIAIAVVIFIIILYLYLSGTFSSDGSGSVSAGTASAPAQSVPAASGPPPLPAGINNGDNIHCTTTGEISHVQDNLRRHYYTWADYEKYGKPAYKVVDCAVLESIPKGANM